MVSVTMPDIEKSINMKLSKRQERNSITELYVCKHDNYKLAAADPDINGTHGTRIEISDVALSWNNRDVN